MHKSNKFCRRVINNVRGSVCCSVKLRAATVPGRRVAAAEGFRMHGGQA